MTSLIDLNTIETVTGQYFCVTNPMPQMVRLEDIVWALSRQARFTGHTASYEIYSVAQHSVFVTQLVTGIMSPDHKWYQSLIESFEDFVGRHSKDAMQVVWQYRNKDFNRLSVQLNALMHDASEAYLADISTPIKILLPYYYVLEAGVQKAITTALNIPEMSEVERLMVRWADMKALQLEAYHMMHSKGVDYELSIAPMNEAQEKIYFDPPSPQHEVRTSFEYHYKLITDNIKQVEALYDAISKSH